MAKTKPTKIIAKSSDGKGYVTGKGKVISKKDIAKNGQNYTVNGKTTLESKKVDGKTVPATKPNSSKKDNLSALPVKSDLKKAAADVKKVLKNNKKVKEVKSVKQLKSETKKVAKHHAQPAVKHVEHHPSKKSHKQITKINKVLAKLTDEKDIAIVKRLIAHWEEVNAPTKSEIVSVPSKNYEEILKKMEAVIGEKPKK